MKKASSLAVVLLAGLLVAVCFLSFDLLHPLLSPPSEPPSAAEVLFSKRLILAPCKIGDGLYMLGHLEPAAVYVIETDEGLAMVDTGLEAEYEKIAQGMTFLGLDLTRLKLILLTHAHGDHSMGAERLRRETGARIYVGLDDAPPLRDGGPWDAIFSRFDMPGVTAHPTTLDGELADGEQLTLGEARITTVATPGHTLGSICFLVEHRGSRILFTGDTVMSLADGLGTYSAYLAPRFRGEVGAYLSSLKKLRAMPKPDLVLPGHPNSDPVPQDPRLTEPQWTGLLDRGILELEQLAERYAQDGADFLDGTPKPLANGLYYLGDLNHRAAYAHLSATETILFDAAGRGAAAFLASAWRTIDVEAPPITAVLLTSCRPDNTAGLKELVAATGCRVVVSPSGAESIERDVPSANLVSTDNLETIALPSLTALATPGIEESACAYYFQVEHDGVAITGEVPLERGAAELRQLVANGVPRAWNLTALQCSLVALERWRPKLWLSAHPMHGRNANLYDGEWLDVLSRDQKTLRRLLRIASGG